MNLGTYKTFTDSAGFKHTIKLGMFIPDDFLNRFLAPGAALDINVQVTTGAYLGPAISFTLGDVIASPDNPAGKRLNPRSDIVP
jgi:hypothetical protein